MRIVVATTFAPFRPAVADAAADALVAACRAHGADVDHVRLPVGAGLVLACRLTDVRSDRLLCLDAAAALLPHPARRLWLLDAGGLDEEPVRAAVAAAPTVHAADEHVRAHLAAASIPAALLPVPDAPAAWSRVARALMR